jgi:hypothetical protein
MDTSDRGYVVEVVIYEFVFFICLLWGLFQIFYVWKLPHNKDNVKLVQKWFGIPGTIGSSIAMLYFLDSKCHFGIYDEITMSINLLLLIWLCVPPVFVWLRSSSETASIFVYCRVVFRISDKAIFALGILNAVLTFGGYLAMVYFNRIVGILYVICWMAILGFVAFGSALTMMVVLLKSAGSAEKLGQTDMRSRRRLAMKFLLVCFLAVLFILFLGIFSQVFYGIRNEPFVGFYKRLGLEKYSYWITNGVSSYSSAIFIFFGIFMAYAMSYMPLKARHQRDVRRKTTVEVTPQSPKVGDA